MKENLKENPLKIQGTFKGDVYVEGNGFSLDKSSTIDGDIYFKTRGLLDSFSMHETATFKGKKIKERVNHCTGSDEVTNKVMRKIFR